MNFNLLTYFRPRILVILLLGFSSGLPRLLVASTLGAWLLDSGVEKAAIGLFAYVALPYSFNFLWAPLIDHLKIPFLSKHLGRRRSWMVLSQLSLMVCLVYMGGINPSDNLVMIAILALLVAFFSASQDIIIDAYRTEYLPQELYGQGAAMAVLGYRVGMLIAGAGALWIADIDAVSWGQAYMAMAGFMLVGIVTILFASEPDNTQYHHIKSEFFKNAIIAPFADFAQTHKNWILFLLFIAFYRMSDGFIGFMATPFMMDIGFSKSQIAAIGKLYGFGATILGTFIGGLILYKVKIFKSLMIFGVLQIITNLTYILLAIIGAEPWGLILAISCDNLAGGMVTIAAIAFLMKLCNQQYTATQYALFSSLASLASITLAGGAGYVAEIYGWAAMFSLSAILGFPSLILLWIIRKDGIFKIKA